MINRMTNESITSAIQTWADERGLAYSLNTLPKPPAFFELLEDQPSGPGVALEISTGNSHLGFWIEPCGKGIWAAFNDSDPVVVHYELAPFESEQALPALLEPLTNKFVVDHLCSPLLENHVWDLRSKPQTEFCGEAAAYANKKGFDGWEFFTGTAVDDREVIVGVSGREMALFNTMDADHVCAGFLDFEKPPQPIKDQETFQAWLQEL